MIGLSLDAATLVSKFDLLPDLVKPNGHEYESWFAYPLSKQQNNISSRSCFVASCELSRLQAELVHLLLQPHDSIDTTLLCTDVRVYAEKLCLWQKELIELLRYRPDMAAPLFDIQ